MGVRLARAPRVAFIDGDCIANAFWLESLMEGFDGGADIVAGRTVYMGYWAFTKMQRVELPHKGLDTTWPSCNLAYTRDAFLDVGGFDERFVTAEDIDLNFRAIDAGYGVAYKARGLVYAQARDSIKGFLKQAYWNGYGRKQLTLKHGRLWHEYSFRDMLRRQKGFWSRVRMVWAVFGYIRCKLKEDRSIYTDDDGRPRTHNPALVDKAAGSPAAPSAHAQVTASIGPA
jgi:GT2 family glycosyltransferase